MPKVTAEELEEIAERTERIEEEKEAKRLAREEKKFQKELAKKRATQEKFVAPILLIVTILVSIIFYVWYH
jgi:hypothetical protein